jgi:hypothetical protein
VQVTRRALLLQSAWLDPCEPEVRSVEERLVTPTPWAFAELYGHAFRSYTRCAPPRGQGRNPAEGGGTSGDDFGKCVIPQIQDKAKQYFGTVDAHLCKIIAITNVANC